MYKKIVLYKGYGVWKASARDISNYLKLLGVEKSFYKIYYPEDTGIITPGFRSTYLRKMSNEEIINSVDIHLNYYLSDRDLGDTISFDCSAYELLKNEELINPVTLFGGRYDECFIDYLEKYGNTDYNEFERCVLHEYKVVEIPSDVDWTIEEYDGSETIVEKHRTWG